MSKLITLHSRYGQSVWLDYIDRGLLRGGALAALVSEGLRGVTSNPTIFHQAIANSAEYDDSIRDLVQADHEIDATTVYEWLTVQDVQMAADVLEPVFLASERGDGFVSLEVSPHLADDTQATVDAARHLWRAVNRPNLMIKVPATASGLPAIERLVAESVNVNVTLLFSLERYRAVTQAYVRGLAQNPHPQRVASVASFFVSRVDTKVDAALAAIGTPEAEALAGKIAIANARAAYRHFREFFASASFEEQRRRGARVQRPLWASMSTKNPRYSDVMYVEALIGPETVSTLPPETLDAFQARGEPSASLERDAEAARRDLEKLDHLGIDLAAITRELEREGVAKFADSYDQLLEALRSKLVTVTSAYAGE